MEQPEQPQQFTTKVDLLLNEIRGDILRLNDAAAVVEIDIVIPRPANDVTTISYKIEKFRTFQYEFRRLVRNAKQLIPEKLGTKIEKWFDDTAKTNVVTDIKALKYGLQLIDELQDYLFKIGVKDIDMSDPELFPYQFYEDLYNASP